jgi:hypothetical protein
MNKILFPGIGWFLLLLAPLTFAGFYASYFSRLSVGMDSIYHVHAVFMLIWVAMAIVQPWLIARKNTRLHKRIGKASYVIMPLVLLSGYLVIRHTYYKQIAQKAEEASRGLAELSPNDIRAQAAAITMIGCVYLAWLAVFYILAIVHRKKMVYHGTYMFGATLTILGPTTDRLIYNTLAAFGLPYTFFAEHVVFFFIIAVMAGLLYFQWRNRKSIQPAATALGIFVAGLACFFLLPKTAFWAAFMDLIM